MTPLEILQYAFSFAFLSYASFSDIKTREVTNKLWLLYAPTALVLTTLNIIIYRPDSGILVVTNIGVTFILSIALWLVHAVGGADTKALVCIGIAHTTSLLTFGYAGIIMLTAYLATYGKRKNHNLPLIPFLTLSLGLAMLQQII